MGEVPGDMTDEQLARELEGQFETFRQSQWKRGALEYGRYGYLGIDMDKMFVMFKEELVDIANYAQMIFVKLCLLEREYRNAVDAYRAYQRTRPDQEPDVSHGPA